MDDGATSQFMRSCGSVWVATEKSGCADIVVCISQNTKKDLLRFIPDIDEKRICVIYNGVSDKFYPIEKSNDYDMGRFILYIGWRVLYKNFNMVVEAIKNTSFNLVIVGSPLTKEEEAYLNYKLGKSRYRCFVNISDEQLNELYNSAYCLAYPSEYEGFGIPVLEAQRAGCPVIAYNGSSIPEIIGKTPLLLNTTNCLEFREKLSLLEDFRLRNSVIKKGLLNSKRFSWDRTGEEYVKLYKELLCL